MKKNFLIMFIAFSAMTAHAQFEIDSIGKVTIGVDIPNVKNCVQLGDDASLNYYNKTNLYSKIDGHSTGTVSSIIGDAYAPDYGSIGKRIGVLGLAGNRQNGHSFGVYGVVANSRGAGVFGASSATTNYLLPYYGVYAGLFYGETKVFGTFSASNIILPTNEEEGDFSHDAEELDGDALNNLTRFSTTRYTVKNTQYEEDIDDVLAERIKEENNRIHFGLVAKEIEQAYPNLVYKGQDGKTAVNYIELIPVLVQSIKELKNEVDELRGTKESYAKPMGATDIDDITACQNILYQNTPNPFKESTAIRFNLAEDVKSASICIFDMQGKMLKKIPVTPSEEQITINAFELGEGMFLYTLIADGKEIDTKRMILAK